MKKLLFYTLFLVLGLGINAQEKTYNINIVSSSLYSVSLCWIRTDGTSDMDTTQAITWYNIEYGIKGFQKGSGVSFLSSWAGCNLDKLIPGTDYSLFIRKQSVSADSSVWFEEYNFKTLSCNTAISNIKTEMEYANGINIKDLIGVNITFDALADSSELEFGLKGFEKGSGTIIKSVQNRFSIKGNANLQSNTEYDFYIRAKCNNVNGEWSEKNTFATTEVLHYAGSEAFDVVFENITNKSAIAHWGKIVGGAYSKYYIIEYGPKGFARGTGKIESATLNSFELTGLDADTEYSFFIRSYNKDTSEPVWLTEHTVKTLPCTTEISGVESEEVFTTCYCGGGSVHIKWDDKADTYELEYGLKNFQQGRGYLLEVARGSDISIPAILESFTDYDFYIRAKCDGVFGDWSPKNTFTTGDLSYEDIKNVQSSSFEIYPNPVGELLTIKLNPAFDISNITITLFDLMGSVRYTSGYKDNYNLSLLPTGTYIIRVNDEKLSEAMIIQKK